MLLNRDHNRFAFFLDENIKSELTRRLRLHRIANTLVTMYNANIEIFRDRKANLFDPQNNTKLKIGKPCFYTSREFKELSNDMVKVKNGRAIGIMLTGTEIFMVYNTENREMKWDYRSELDMTSGVSDFLIRQKELEQKINDENVENIFE